MSPDVVAIEARKHTGLAAGAEPVSGPSVRRSRAAVVTLEARRRAALPDDGRPAPSVADYDALLTRTGEQVSATGQANR